MDLKKLNLKFSEIELPRLELPKFKLPNIKMPSLKIGDIKARIPIIQGGMGVGISLSKLSSSVANEGGIGVIAANAIGMIEPDYFKNGLEANMRALRKEIRKARSLSDGIIGVNIMIALNDFRNMLQVSIEEKVDIVFLGAGLPLRGIPIEEIKKANVKVVPIVSSARAAKLIFRYWQKNYNTIPDGVVVEGPKAGGHLGFKEEDIENPDFSLENIIPGVIEEIKEFEKEFAKKIPVIAAGGIYNGKDIYQFLKLGANGVQMGSRFVATEECDADINFKKSYVDSKKEDIVIIKSPVGMPGRAILNTFLKDVNSGKKKEFKCPWRCLESCKADKANYCISIALDNARKGILKHGFAFAGTNAYRIDKIVPVNELINEITQDYLAVVENGIVRIKNEFEKVKKKLNALKEEYEKTIERVSKHLKEEYNKTFAKTSPNLKGETEKSFNKIDWLKSEYIENSKLIDEIKAKFMAKTFGLI